MDRRHQNPGRPPTGLPRRVPIHTTVAVETAAILAEVSPRQRGRLIDEWAEMARKISNWR
jgi:hypothetical protein